MLNQNSKYYKIFENKVLGTDKKVMLALLKHMEIDTNLVTVNGDTLDLICGDLGVSKAQVRNALTRLVKLRLLERTKVVVGEYVINPSFAWKGNEEKVWRYYTEFEFQARLQGEINEEARH